MKPFDLQVNGYAGADFCSLQLTAEQLHVGCEALREDGFDGILATVITDSIENLELKLNNLVRLREQDELAREVIAGFHIEGPFLNPNTGYIGAHSPNAVKEGNKEDAKRLWEASNGLAKLVTLAPEHDPDSVVTSFFSNQNVTVSAGHCNPTVDQLQAATDHGLSMITHFGNGCPVELPRHDNVLQRMLRLREHFWFCFIPDGAHVDFVALQNYMDFVGIDRTIMTTDAIAATKLGPGLHQLSGLTIEVDESGIARRPGSQNLAGSTITMPQLRRNLQQQLGMSEDEIGQVIDRNPRGALSL